MELVAHSTPMVFELRTGFALNILSQQNISNPLYHFNSQATLIARTHWMHPRAEDQAPCSFWLPYAPKTTQCIDKKAATPVLSTAPLLTSNCGHPRPRRARARRRGDVAFCLYAFTAALFSATKLNPEPAASGTLPSLPATYRRVNVRRPVSPFLHCRST